MRNELSETTLEGPGATGIEEISDTCQLGIVGGRSTYAMRIKSQQTRDLAIGQFGPFFQDPELG